MKLLFCLSCYDVFKLGYLEVKKCSCGKTSGQYIDYLNAEYKGSKGIPLGISNVSIAASVKKQPKSGLGERFESFVIAKDCETFKKVRKFKKVEKDKND